MTSNAWLTIAIKEGKNRNSRVMEFLGYSVSRLIRTSYGPFQLGAMKEDDLQEVKQTILREQLGQSNTNFLNKLRLQLRGKKNKQNKNIQFFEEIRNNNANNRRNKARRKAR